jgi:hypothetical protein
VNADPTRPAAQATLPVKGRDLSPASVAHPQTLAQLRMCCMIDDADAGLSLPFTGRVAREARRVGF